MMLVKPERSIVYSREEREEVHPLFLHSAGYVIAIYRISKRKFPDNFIWVSVIITDFNCTSCRAGYDGPKTTWLLDIFSKREFMRTIQTDRPTLGL